MANITAQRRYWYQCQDAKDFAQRFFVDCCYHGSMVGWTGDLDHQVPQMQFWERVLLSATQLLLDG